MPVNDVSHWVSALFAALDLLLALGIPFFIKIKMWHGVEMLSFSFDIRGSHNAMFVHVQFSF